MADTSLDFGELSLNECCVFALAVVFDQDFVSFIAAVLGYQPTEGNILALSTPSSIRNVLTVETLAQTR